MKINALAGVIILSILLVGQTQLVYSQETEKTESPKKVKIVYQKIKPGETGITIPVSDVKLPVNKLYEIKYLDLVSKLSSGNIEAIPENMENSKFVFTRVHPMIGALHYSFAHHRPVAISPDMVWLMIMQGLVKHFYYNSDSLKSDVYSADGKTKITIRRDDFVKGDMTNKWSEVFPDFSNEISETLNPDLHKLFTHSFTTTNQNVSISYIITMMDAFSEYYSFEVMTACGIPYVVLEGSPQDWKWIKDQLPGLRKYGLDFWIDDLQPVVDEIYNSSKGKVNTSFWQSIYKWQGESGGPLVSGWIIKFFPYMENTDDSKQINPFLAYDFSAVTDSENYYFVGLSDNDFSSGLSMCDFNWKYYNQNIDMQFFAGFVGVKQDENLVLRPEINWFLAEKPDTTSAEIQYEDYGYMSWLKEAFIYGTEIDYISPCSRSLEMLFIETCPDPDTYPIFDSVSNSTYEEGIVALREFVNSYASSGSDYGKAKVVFVVTAEGECLCAPDDSDNGYLNYMASEIMNYTDNWKPGTKDGKPVAVEITLELEITNNY